MSIHTHQTQMGKHKAMMFAVQDPKTRQILSLFHLALKNMKAVKCPSRQTQFMMAFIPIKVLNQLQITEDDTGSCYCMSHCDAVPVEQTLGQRWCKCTARQVTVVRFLWMNQLTADWSDGSMGSPPGLYLTQAPTYGMGRTEFKARL